MKRANKATAAGFMRELGSFVSDSRFGTVFCGMLVILYIVNHFVAKNPFAQIALGFFAVFFAPGYLWMDILSGKTRINDRSERFVTAIALSIGLVILLVVFISLILRVPLTPDTVVMAVALLSLAGLAARKMLSRKLALQ